MAHSCWDRRCKEHEDGYVGNPDLPPEGEFVQRYDGNSNVHIAHSIEVVEIDDERWTRVRTAWGLGWNVTALRHANGDSPRQCAKCWDAM
jgi:hypothetical protein